MSIVRNRPTPQLPELIKPIGGKWSGDTAQVGALFASYASYGPTFQWIVGRDDGF